MNTGGKGTFHSVLIYFLFGEVMAYVTIMKKKFRAISLHLIYVPLSTKKCTLKIITIGGELDATLTFSLQLIIELCFLCALHLVVSIAKI